MSDTKYNFDDYIFDNVLEDRLYDVDFENKVMRGVNVEAVRCVVGRDDFSNFFRPSQILKDSIDTEGAIQLMSPMDGVYYCRMHGDLEYPVEFSELMFKATTETLCGLMSSSRLEPMVDKGFANLVKDIDSARKYCNAVTPRLIDYFEDCAQYLKEKTAYMSLSDKTRETIDKVCENFEWNETKRIEARFADVVAQEGRKHIDVSEAENDGQEMEF